MNPPVFRHREEIRVAGLVSEDDVPTDISGWEISATLHRASTGGSSDGDFAIERGATGEYVATFDSASLPAPSTVAGAAGITYWIDVVLKPAGRPPVLPPRIPIRIDP